MSAEQFCLKWSDFQGTFSYAFDELWQNKELLDVTLACDDDQIQAHKTALSACSPFFRSILTKNPQQQNLFIYLKGVKYRDLLSVLDFMYQGEVNIEQDRLDSFLEAAEELKVKGLTNKTAKPDYTNKTFKSAADITNKNASHTNTLSKRVLRNAIFSKTEDERQISPVFIDVEDDEQLLETMSEEIYKPYIAKEEERFTHNKTSLPHESSFLLGQVDSSRKGQFLNEMIDTLMGKNSENRWQCSSCDYNSARKENVINHVEAKHLKTDGFNCDTCWKHLATRNALRVHKIRNHSKSKATMI